MVDLLGLDTWGTNLLLWIQSFGSPVLDSLFLAITWLGDEQAYLLVLPLIFWCVNRRWGLRLFYIAMLSVLLNEFLKDLFRLPRPDPAIVRRVTEAVGYGMPSGHAQTGAAVVWLYLAAQVRRSWFSVLAILLVFLIGLSRAVLGVHYPQDILAGWILGVIVVLLSLRLQGPIGRIWNGLPGRTRTSLTVLLPLTCLLLVPADSAGHYPAETAGTVCGILIGVTLAGILETQTGEFQVEGTLVRRAARYPLGIAIIAVPYLAGSLIPDLSPWGLDIVVRVIRYAVVGLAGFWFAPWVFVRLGLARSTTTSRRAVA